MKRQLRIPTTYQSGKDNKLGVSRQASTIVGVVAMQEGEALGHNIWADQTTLEMAGRLSNAMDGVPGRFGHPGISENATGKKLSLARDFNVDGDKLRFNMGLLESARKSPSFSQDPVDYMLTLAELEPTQMGMSYVLQTDLAWTFQDGTERELTDEEYGRVFFDGDIEPPENALTPLPVMRPTEVRFLDIVNEGALTSQGGLFEMSIASDIFSGRSSEYLVELFDLLDRFRRQYKVPANEMAVKAKHILNEYLSSRGAKMDLENIVTLEEYPESLVGEAPDENEQQDIEDSKGINELEGDMSSLMSDLSAEPEEPTVTASQLAHVQGQLALVLGTVDKQNSEIRRLTNLMRQSLEAIQMLHRNQQRLAGEAVVSEAVSVSPTLGLDAVNFEHPKPDKDIAPPRKRPIVAETEIAQRNFSINAARQKAFGVPSKR